MRVFSRLLLRGATYAFIFVICALLSVCPVTAQKAVVLPPSATSLPLLNKIVKIDSPHIAFWEALKLLTRQYGLNFVADGSPVLPMTDFKANGTLRAALDSLADTFDYTWQITPDKIILMNKRFHNPDEAPQAHLSELRQTMRDVMGLFAPFDFDHSGNWEASLDLLNESLTATQMRLLNSGQRLSAVNLSIAQRGFLQRAINTNNFDEMYREWEKAARGYESLDDAAWLIFKRYTLDAGFDAYVTQQDQHTELFHLHAFVAGNSKGAILSVFKQKEASKGGQE